ncbi:hypothetical protein MCEMIH15_00644 [Caulobacteraceae bacterium]
MSWAQGFELIAILIELAGLPDEGQHGCRLNRAAQNSLYESPPLSPHSRVNTTLIQSLCAT